MKMSVSYVPQIVGKQYAMNVTWQYYLKVSTKKIKWFPWWDERQKRLVSKNQELIVSIAAYVG